LVDVINLKKDLMGIRGRRVRGIGVGRVPERYV
jgi:hypothetical protein